MDDVIDSISGKKKAGSTTRDIGKLIDKGEFKVIGWIFSGAQDSSSTHATTQEVLRVA